MANWISVVTCSAIFLLVQGYIIESQLTRLDVRECTCPGDLVRYMCTTPSDTGTLTLHSVGDCELRLLNRRFGTNVSLDECMDGQLNAVSRGVREENGTLISSLNFTTAYSVNVSCSLDSSLNVAGMDSISIITENFDFPSTIHVSQDLAMRTCTFSWSFNCSDVRYTYIANCTSNSTCESDGSSVTCYDVKPGNRCFFRVIPETCNGTVGQTSPMEVCSMEDASMSTEDSNEVAVIVSSLIVAVLIMVAMLLIGVSLFYCKIWRTKRRGHAKLDAGRGMSELDTMKPNGSDCDIDGPSDPAGPPGSHGTIGRKGFPEPAGKKERGAEEWEERQNEDEDGWEAKRELREKLEETKIKVEKKKHDATLELQKTKENLKSALEEKRQIEEKLQEQEKISKGLSDDLHKKEQDISDLQEKLAEKDTEISGLQEELATKDTEKSGLQKKLDAKDSEITELQEKVATKDKEIKDLDSELEDLKWKICGLQDQLKALDEKHTKTISDLRQQLKEDSDEQVKKIREDFDQCMKENREKQTKELRTMIVDIMKTNEDNTQMPMGQPCRKETVPITETRPNMASGVYYPSERGLSEQGHQAASEDHDESASSAQGQDQGQDVFDATTTNMVEAK